MVKRTLVSLFGLAAVLFLGSPSYAQTDHGANSAANHGPNGMGATHGNSSTVGSNRSVDAGKKTPDQLLSQNRKLSSKLQSLLPKGVTPQQACNGFKNLGQCVAAIHVSHNLSIPFACLKADVTRTAAPTGATCAAGTGTKKLTLGQSIEALKPGSDGKTEAKKAAKQADDDLMESQSSS
jgi:hypothetical protein